MVRKFIGGSRNGCEADGNLVPYEAFQNIGDGAIIKMSGNNSSELYVLVENDCLKYQFTFSPKKWGKNGDPCPFCNSKQTNLVNTIVNPKQVVPVWGGNVYELSGKRTAIVQCDTCGNESSVLLD